jgi:hypothetical protein
MTGPGGLAYDFQRALSDLGAGGPVYAASTNIGTAVATPSNTRLTLIEAGGHWNVFGKPDPRYEVRVVRELAEALRQGWQYAPGARHSGSRIPIADRAGTMALAADIVAALPGMVSEHGDLDPVAVERLAVKHERPDLVRDVVLSYVTSTPGAVPGEFTLSRQRHGAGSDSRSFPTLSRPSPQQMRGLDHRELPTTSKVEWLSGSDGKRHLRFTSDQVVSRLLKDRNDRVVGVSFMPSPDYLVDFAKAEGNDTRLLESGVKSGVKSGDLPNRALVTSTPPGFVVGMHGNPGGARGYLYADKIGELAVTGRTLAKILIKIKNFRDALAGDGQVLLWVCEAGRDTQSGGLAYDLHAALRDFGAAVPVYGATTVVTPRHSKPVAQHTRKILVINQGGHWNVFGELSLERWCATVLELVAAFRMGWQYEPGSKRVAGSRIPIADRAGTMDLLRDIVDGLPKMVSKNGKLDLSAVARFAAERHGQANLVLDAVVSYVVSAPGAKRGSVRSLTVDVAFEQGVEIGSRDMARIALLGQSLAEGAVEQAKSGLLLPAVKIVGPERLSLAVREQLVRSLSQALHVLSSRGAQPVIDPDAIVLEVGSAGGDGANRAGPVELRGATITVDLGGTAGSRSDGSGTVRGPRGIHR